MPKRVFANDGARRLFAARRARAEGSYGNGIPRPLSYGKTSKLILEKTGRLVPRELIWAYEKGRSVPQWDNRMAMAQALGIPPISWNWEPRETRAAEVAGEEELAS